MAIDVRDPERRAVAEAASPLRLSRMAVGRVSDSLDPKAETATGTCGRLSLSAGSAYSRMRLVSSRSSVRESGEVDCAFGSRG